LLNREAFAAMAWTPDSKHLLIAHSVEVKKWSEIAAILPPARSAYLIAQAEELQREILAYTIVEGTEPELKYDTEKIRISTDDELLAIFLYLWERRTPEFEQKVRKMWEKDIARLDHARIYALECYDVKGLDLINPKILYRSLERIQDIRPSPDGTILAFTSGESLHDVQFFSERSSPDHLYVLPLKPDAKPTLIAEGTAVSPDWTADSRMLVFVRANAPALVGGDGLQLGAVSIAAVRGKDGELLEDRKIEDLAGMVFYAEARVRCLRDGRILFSGADIHLPCTAKEMPSRQALFMLDPERQAVVTRLIPRSAQERIGDSVQEFELSPDQTRVIIPDSHGEHTILTIKDGDVRGLPVAPSHLKLSPSWRTNDEVSVAKPILPNTNGKRESEIQIWSLGTNSGEVISTHWPDDAIKGILIPNGDDGKKKASN
jgi:hypothetical protein